VDRTPEKRKLGCKAKDMMKIPDSDNPQEGQGEPFAFVY
jgi:hypothetical protein